MKTPADNAKAIREIARAVDLLALLMERALDGSEVQIANLRIASMTELLARDVLLAVRKQMQKLGEEP